jgi:multiple sugar transport system substrate-binding protein
MESERSGPGSFGKCLRRLRREAGLTQQMLADRSGISVDAISNHENGRARCPHPDTVKLLANGLGLGPAARAALMAARRDERPRRPRSDVPLPEHAAVFLSYTSELDEQRHGRSLVAAARSAANRAGHVPTDMDYFTARNQDPADYCMARVAGADVYVAIVGLRYGEPVRSRPDLSHTELEFDTATACGLPRLVFLVREDAPALSSVSQSPEHRTRQEAFRRRLQTSGVMTVWVATPAELEIRLYQALVELRTDERAGRAGGTRSEVADRPGPSPRRKLAFVRRWRLAEPAPRGLPRRTGPAQARRRSRRHLLPALAMAAALSVLLAARMVTTPLMNVSRTLVPQVATVAFFGSQAQPAAEARAMTTEVLNGFGEPIDFNSQDTAAQDISAILNEQQKTGVSTIDVIDLTDSDMAALQANGSLQDLTALLHRLEATRTFPGALLEAGRFGTDKQYFIPWLQATYIMVVNKKALQYLPKGYDVNHLTYDQLIAWGQAIEKATGYRRIGLPAERGIQGGLIQRLLQGYLYPSFTGASLTSFASPKAVQVWQTLKRLWAVTNPSSENYTSMQGPLLSGDVWIAWDHQARLEAALRHPDEFQAIPAPSGPMGRGYMTAVVGLAIPHGALNQAGAEALINWLTRPVQQAEASASLSFFPVIHTSGLAAPQSAELSVDDIYRGSARGIPTRPPVGLGAETDEFTMVYQDTFNRIVLHDEDIRAVLDDETPRLQQIVDRAHAPCWPPDSPSSGPCQIM